MGNMDKITKEIELLSLNERIELRQFLDELDARSFDEAIERDAKSGKLDELLKGVRERQQVGDFEEL